MPKYVDHINRDKLDNRIENLRESSSSENLANKEKPCTNSSGYKNVVSIKSTGKWGVRVMKDEKEYWGGTFSSLRDAVDSANELRYELFGEFATYEQYIPNK